MECMCLNPDVCGATGAGGHDVFRRRAARGDSYLSVGHPFIGLFWFPEAQTGTIFLRTKGGKKETACDISSALDI